MTWDEVCYMILEACKAKYLYGVLRLEKIVRRSLLYDFYGELLTEHQKRIYEDVVMNDLSYSEIARENGISRQGVYDMIKRADKILEEYEEKLKLVEKFEHAGEKVSAVKEDIMLLKDRNRDPALEALISDIACKTAALLEEF